MKEVPVKLRVKLDTKTVVLTQGRGKGIQISDVKQIYSLASILEAIATEWNGGKTPELPPLEIEG
jgi:hypothetical protein